jgi:hypothetical protein
MLQYLLEFVTHDEPTIDHRAILGGILKLNDRDFDKELDKALPYIKDCLKKAVQNRREAIIHPFTFTCKKCGRLFNVNDDAQVAEHKCLTYSPASSPRQVEKAPCKTDILPNYKGEHLPSSPAQMPDAIKPHEDLEDHAAATSDSSSTPTTPTVFTVDQRVRVHSLASKPELNGSMVSVVSFNSNSNRYTIKFDDNKAPIALKAQNLAKEGDEQSSSGTDTTADQNESIPPAPQSESAPAPAPAQSGQPAEVETEERPLRKSSAAALFGTRARSFSHSSKPR